MRIDRNSDITRNVKIIEWMKNEILMSVSELFNILFKGVRSADETLQDILANIIMITYLLAKRLGISFEEVDYKIKEKVSLGIKEEHSVEKWYGDLTNLKDHIENRE
ncbi:MAG: MazG-like family protein [Intestinibacter sp.]